MLKPRSGGRGRRRKLFWSLRVSPRTPFAQPLKRQMRKQELLDQLQAFGLDATGDAKAMRKRLRAYGREIGRSGLDLVAADPPASAFGSAEPAEPSTQQGPGTGGIFMALGGHLATAFAYILLHFNYIIYNIKIIKINSPRVRTLVFLTRPASSSDEYAASLCALQFQSVKPTLHPEIAPWWLKTDIDLFLGPLAATHYDSLPSYMHDQHFTLPSHSRFRRAARAPRVEYSKLQTEPAVVRVRVEGKNNRQEQHRVSHGWVGHEGSRVYT
jgi:hypothetical protein